MASTFIINTDEIAIENLKVIESKPVLVTETDTTYIILNGDPTLFFQEDDICGRINAVVLNDDTREILAIGPSKPYTIDNFKNKYGDVKSVEITEMIEGLFFQLFWDERIGKWEIGTINGIFGNYSYYRMPHIKSPTYRIMICQAMGLNDEEVLNDWKGLQYLDKKYCFHFVLQHPDNHLVFKIIKPTIFVIGAFKINANQIEYVPAKDYKNMFPTDSVLFPPVLGFDPESSYEKLLDTFVSIQQPNTRMGIVIKHVLTGATAIAVNPAYEELQRVRGTHPNILYHYLCLKRIKKTEDFLRLFPQYQEFFSDFNHLYESLITKIHQSYVDHFVLKKKVTIHKKYYYHIKQIHRSIYIPSLREENKIIIKKKVVRDYVERLEPGHILHILQYELYLLHNTN